MNKTADCINISDSEEETSVLVIGEVPIVDLTNETSFLGTACKPSSLKRSSTSISSEPELEPELGSEPDLPTARSSPDSLFDPPLSERYFQPSPEQLSEPLFAPSPESSPEPPAQIYSQPLPEPSTVTPRQKVKRFKELRAVQRVAERANGVGKAEQNCIAKICKTAVKIIDPDGYTIRTLFDEASASHEVVDYAQYDSSITWSYKRTEAVDLRLTETFKEAEWMIIVMDGADYLRRILLYRDDADNCETIKSFICDTMRSSGLNLILLVYNLSKSLKDARRLDEKEFRKNFKSMYESNRQQQHQADSTGGPKGAASIGITDLQDLRLDLELEIKFEHPSWKFQIDFEERREDAVTAVVRYTKAVAKLEIERRKTEQMDFDWAINADKERAIDPLKSLTQLWEKQLLQFGQLTTPVAKAITAEYPSPAALIEQYKQITPDEGETLLAELHIGRLKRQVGLNISRRVYHFMTSRDPKFHLGVD